MGTYLADKCDEIRNWFAIGEDVYPDVVVTSWIRMAEEQLSAMLRVKHMIQVDTSIVKEERVPLPKDWQELRLVRLLPTGGVVRYTTPDAFYNPEWNADPDPNNPTGKLKTYTILGNYLIIGGTNPDPGQTVEVTYYGDIPPLSDDVNNWINYYHPTVYTVKILHVASMYAIEDDRSAMWGQQALDNVQLLNQAHKIDKASGSVLMPVRKKTFG